MAETNAFLSTVVMGGLLIVVATYVWRVRSAHGYTVERPLAGTPTGASTAASASEPTPESFRPFRFLLGVMLLVGAIGAVVEAALLGPLSMAVGVVAFFVFVYTGLVSVLTSRVI